MTRRWDSGYGKPQDPLPKDTYNVTDEEKAYWNGKQDRLVYDPVPTEDSINAVTSGAVYTAIEDRAEQTAEEYKEYFNSSQVGLQALSDAIAESVTKLQAVQEEVERKHKEVVQKGELVDQRTNAALSYQNGAADCAAAAAESAQEAFDSANRVQSAIDAAITEQDVQRIVTEYVAAHKDELKGDKGETGNTPNLTIGTVETLPSGSDATASITGDKENPVLNLGIPKGADGKVHQPINLLEGINWCAIGDSFTWGDPANEKFTDRNGKEWCLTATTWLANEIEANLSQVGLGGAHFMPKIVDGKIDTSVANYIMNPNWWYGIKNLQSNTQLITIQIGLNDNGHTNFPIGSYGDETLLTSYGAFKILMDKIKETCPLAKIGLIVSDAFLRTEYANFLYDLSKKYNLPILDLSSSTVGTIYGTSAGDSYNYNFASAEVKTANNEKYRISSTNGHPNTESHKLRADKMRLFINSCVLNYGTADDIAEIQSYIDNQIGGALNGSY